MITMDNRIGDIAMAIHRDKPPIYYLGIACLSLGFQINTVTMASAGLEIPTLPEQDNIVKGFYITGFIFCLFSFVLAVTSLFKDTINPRAALVLALLTAFIGAFCTGTAITVYGIRTIDRKYRPDEFDFVYPYSAYVSATFLCVVGALALLISLCND